VPLVYDLLKVALSWVIQIFGKGSISSYAMRYTKF